MNVVKLFARGSLTAAVASIGDVADGKKELPSATNWQRAAWEHWRVLPEVGYPSAVTSSTLGRYKMGIVNGMTGDRQDVRDDALGDLAKQVLWWLTGETGNFAPMGSRWGLISPVVGEALILTTEDHDYGVATEVVDRSELVKERRRVGNSYRDVWKRQSSTGGEAIELDPAVTSVHRVWVPGKKSGDAHSPMAYLDKQCCLLETMYGFLEGLMNSRLARNGILFIPSSVTITAAQPVPDGTMANIADPVLRELLYSIITNLRRRNAASDAMPIVIRGPDDSGEKIKWITMDSTLAESDMRLRNELREEIASGLWLPQEFASGKGLGDANHFSSWAVKDSAKTDFYDPSMAILTDALSLVWLRPLISAMFNMHQEIPAEVQFWRLVPDDSQVNVPADRTRLSTELRDRYALSNAALRRETGANELDAPTPEEYVRQIGVATGNPYFAFYGLDLPPDFDITGGMGGLAPPPDPSGQYQAVGPGSPNPGDPNYSRAGGMA